MGTATIGAYTLTSVTHIERPVSAILAVHDIPGATSIVQQMGRHRDVMKIHGILSPSSEIGAVINIGTLTNAGNVAAAVSVTIGGQDWATGNTFNVEKVDVETQPGMNAVLPWGHYTITLREAG